jgi:hypothetical protein
LALCACASTSSAHYALTEGATVEPRSAPSEDLASSEAPPAAVLSLAALLQAPGFTERRASPSPSASSSPQRVGAPFWPAGHTVMQGFLGAYLLETVEQSGGSAAPVDGSDDDLSQIPAIGGGAQWKYGGERVDFGFEGMISFGWTANATAFATGGSGAVIAVDVDLLLIDLYGGPFVSVFLGDRWRLYGAAGPMMHWAEYDQEGASVDDSGGGFGTGLYARTGLELIVRPDLMVGVGARWSDSTIDLNGGLGDLDVEGLQVALTVTTGI